MMFEMSPSIVSRWEKHQIRRAFVVFSDLSIAGIESKAANGGGIAKSSTSLFKLFISASDIRSVWTREDAENAKHAAVGVEGGEGIGDCSSLLWQEAKMHVARFPGKEFERALLGFLVKGTNIIQLNLRE